MSLDRKILDKIEKEKIAIIPRWVFIVKKFFSWLYAVMLLVISSFALAVAIFVMRISGWESFESMLSYAWLAIFAGLFAWGYRKIVQAGFPQMYKLSFALVIPFILSANIILGFVFYESGQIKKVEMKLEEIPVYKNLLPFEKNIIENEDWETAEERIDSKNIIDDIDDNQKVDQMRIDQDNNEIIREEDRDIEDAKLQQQKLNDNVFENNDTNASAAEIKGNKASLLKSKDNNVSDKNYSKAEEIDDIDDEKDEVENKDVIKDSASTDIGDGQVKGVEIISSENIEEEAIDVPEVD